MTDDLKIGIVNYSLGNVGSVLSAFDFYKREARLVQDAAGLKDSDLIVLAGVGNFKTAVAKLREANLWEPLHEEVMGRRKPVLGICLGMQLFSDVSFEDGATPGFGWIPGQVVKLAGAGLRVPHIGWEQIAPRAGESRAEELFKGMRYNSFYFMHSYHFVPQDRAVVQATAPYGELEIVAAVRQEHICGVQFHPEKSQGDGLRFLRNLLETML